MIQSLFGALGLPLSAAELFGSSGKSYCLDWYDTEAAEKALGLQNHGFAEYGKMMARQYAFLRPLILRRLARLSPYRNSPGKVGAALSRVAVAMKVAAYDLIELLVVLHDEDIDHVGLP